MSYVIYRRKWSSQRKGYDEISKLHRRRKVSFLHETPTNLEVLNGQAAEQAIMAGNEAFMSGLSSDRVEIIRETKDISAFFDWDSSDSHILKSRFEVSQHDSKRVNSRKQAKRKAKRDLDEHVETTKVSCRLDLWH